MCPNAISGCVLEYVNKNHHHQHAKMCTDVSKGESGCGCRVFISSLNIQAKYKLHPERSVFSVDVITIERAIAIVPNKITGKYIIMSYLESVINLRRDVHDVLNQPRGRSYHSININMSIQLMEQSA